MPPSSDSPHLAIVGGLPPRALSLTPGAFVVGRAPDADIQVAHLEVSRHHSRFYWDGETCAVEDLDSRRGTRVNGAPVEARTALQPGDKIAIGPVLMEFRIGPIQLPVEAGAAAGGSKTAVMLVRGAPADRIAVAEGEELTIGRDPHIEVVLDHPGVSRRHASVRALPGAGYRVTDLHSTAGSFVNGQRFDEQDLTVGDRLQIGPYCFQYDGQALARVSALTGGTVRVADVVQKVEDRTLLDQLNFAIPGSQFTGILGPSGAGKSTLLHTLAGLFPPTRGRVLVDGRDIYARGGAYSFGFVPQDDIVHPELTVAQALGFSARLRLPASTPDLELQKLILQTMDQLGLRALASSPISRLSGGQRKRVSVGVELLARPSILFLDEPSSGLDPATEFQLMELLRDLADTGCTVICTTHVMENAYLMDQFLVLSAGCLVFQGSAQEAREYFGVGKLSALYDRLPERPAKEWQEAFDARPGGAQAAQDAGASASAAPRTSARRSFALPILLKRQWAILAADWRNFAILLGQPLLIAALVSWVTDDQSLALFFAYVATLWFGCSNAAQEIVKERAIYRRERLVGVTAGAYLSSKFLFLTAITAAQALLLYGCLLAGERGLNGAMGWQIGALIGTALASVGIGSAISALARSVMQAVLIVPLVLIPQILFSGHPVPAHEMKPSVYLVSRLTPSFAAQRLMDVSFLWQKKIARDTLSDHWTSFRNLNRDGRLRTGDTFSRADDGVQALITHGAWGGATFLLALLALRADRRR